MKFPFKNIGDGKIFNILEPDASLLTIEYIAFALSGINRFGGDAYPFCSVGQHSINCQRYLEHYYPDDYLSQYSGLAHDFAESIIGDAPSPMKNYLYFKTPEGFLSYSEAEHKINENIESIFGLPVEYGFYKEADIAVRIKESEVFVKRPVIEEDWDYLNLRETPDSCVFQTMDRDAVIDEFVWTFHRLKTIIKDRKLCPV